MLGLTSEGYEKAVNVINTSRSLLDNVVSGIGFDTDDAKEGVDDLFDYVKEMIKDNVDRQVDALEELKDKYSEIIDLKKESLQASKDEADYQDEVADKVKEMAKLQEKINALALDDSRSSVAKRKELEEQLADAQKELQQTQADEAYDKQTDNLDKMQEAYEKQKDAEIKKLVETARENCHKLLQENINLLHALAKALLDRETITGDDIDLLVKGEPLLPFDADGSAAKQEPAAPAPASADAGGETFKLEAEPSQDGGTGEKTQDETKQQ
mgnify:CR=1 FL=1